MPVGLRCRMRGLQFEASARAVGRDAAKVLPTGLSVLERERLNEIVIRTAAQAADTILQASARGKHQNG